MLPRKHTVRRAIFWVGFTLSACFGLQQELIAADEGLDTPVAEGAKLELLYDQAKFTEGPATNRAGEVYFTDQPNDRILKVDLDGKVSEFLKPAGRSNGMFFDDEDKLLACADENNELWEIDSSGKHTLLLREFDGKRLNGPNDLWISKTGEIYFTDPYYQRPWWNHKKMPQDGQHVYRVDRNGKNLKRVAEGLKQPNGIIGDRSRNLLYVADIGAGKTYKYQIDEQGELVNRELFCEQGSDGMTIDIAGNVYLTGKGVSVYSREGKHVATIEVPENWTANVCFGGAEQNQLFITASDSIYRLQMKTTAADHSGTK